MTSFSSGEYGNACSVRRRWFVEDEDVSVEFGRMTFRDTKSELFAFRIAAHHSSRSSSVAAQGEGKRYATDNREEGRTSIHSERLLWAQDLQPSLIAGLRRAKRGTVPAMSLK